MSVPPDRQARRPWPGYAVLLALAGMLTAIALAPASVVTGFALALALVVPGAALMSATLKGEFTGSLLQGLALSVVLSAALYVLIALGLDAAGIALTRGHVLVATDALVVLSCGWGLLTRRGPPVLALPPLPVLLRTAVPVASLAAAGAVVLAMSGSTAERSAPYQAMYPTGPAAQGQTLRVVGGRSRLGLSVVNRTGAPRSYVLTTATGPRWPSLPIDVPAGGTWSGTLTGPVPPSACRMRLEVQLRDASDQRVLTDLSVWLGGAGRAPRSAHPPVLLTTSDGTYCG